MSTPLPDRPRRGKPWWTARAGVLLVALSCLALAADGRFAASNGEFAGRRGDTCVLCHAPAATAPAARLALEGLPARWDAGAHYDLTVRVTGGPTPAHASRPQGGFEMEASAGTFRIGAGMDGLLRFPQPGVITYTPEGTRTRAWQVAWTAPSLDAPPAPVTFWLAGVAANGNHVVSGDDGESGDATAHLQRTLRPSEATLVAWRALPLLPPVLDEVRPEADGWLVRGHHADANATHLAYRLQGPWTSVATGPAWTLRTPHHPDRLDLRSEGHGRASVPLDDAQREETPFAGLLLIPVLAATAALRRTTTTLHASH